MSEKNFRRRRSLAERGEAKRKSTARMACHRRDDLLRADMGPGGATQAVGAAGLLKLTLGASRSAADETSKNSRCLKPSIPAKMLEGNCRILVFRSRTTAL